jgi:hypothetical protein
MRTDIVDVSALSNVPATDGFQSKSASRTLTAEQRMSPMLAAAVLDATPDIQAAVGNFSP